MYIQFSRVYEIHIFQITQLIWSYFDFFNKMFFFVPKKKS